MYIVKKDLEEKINIRKNHSNNFIKQIDTSIKQLKNLKEIILVDYEINNDLVKQYDPRYRNFQMFQFINKIYNNFTIFNDAYKINFSNNIINNFNNILSNLFAFEEENSNNITAFNSNIINNDNIINEHNNVNYYNNNFNINQNENLLLNFNNNNVYINQNENFLNFYNNMNNDFNQKFY